MEKPHHRPLLAEDLSVIREDAGARWRELFAALGLEVDKRKSKPEDWWARSPLAGPEGDRTPSFHMQAGGRWYCFSTRRGGGPIELVREMFSLSNSFEAGRKLVELGFGPEAVSPGPEPVKRRRADRPRGEGKKKAEVNRVIRQDLTPLLDLGHGMLGERGISEATARDFGVGFLDPSKSRSRLARRLVFQVRGRIPVAVYRIPIFGPKLWAKPVDGRASPDLEAAITQFQRNNRTNPSGRIDAMGPDMQVIDRSLPQDRKSMAVVENCSAVLCTSLPSHQGQEAQRVARERTLLPREAAGQLAEFIRNVQAQMGLTLRPDGHAIDHQGRMIQKLAFADVHWMNNQGQFSQQVPEDKAREVVASLQRRPLPSALEWHTGPMPVGQAAAVSNQRVGNTPSSMGSRPFGNTVLAVRAKQQLRCLCGPSKQVDEQRLRRLGLNLTGDAVIDRMQDVAASMMEGGHV